MTQSSDNPTPQIPSDEIPVLLTIFNRPDKTRAVIESLRNIKPKKLFISADGPRQGVPEDTEKSRLARQESVNIDWECEVHTQFNDENIGCDPAVSSAIGWFFQHVEFGIILEDDCLVSEQYFSFCGELLVRYKDDARIMQISSMSPYAAREYEYDYHFSRAFWCSGGWATWRRAWKYFTPDMMSYRNRDALEILGAYYPNYAKRIKMYRRFLTFKVGHFNNWDFQWNMACYAQNGLSIVPEKNLMVNIGFDEDSTHTREVNPVYENMQFQPLHWPLRHPLHVFADSEPEKSLEKRVFQSLSIKSRCMYLLRQLIGAIKYIRDTIPY